MSSSSYPTILRSASLIGGASFINILASVLKMKVAAILLGPAGVGIVGLYQNLIQTTSTVASLGMANSGARRIAGANAEEDEAKVILIRRVLFRFITLQSLLAALIFLALSNWIVDIINVEPAHEGEVHWLSLGIVLTVAAGAQSAMLTGLRRIGDIAWTQLASGVLSTVFSIIALWFWGDAGLLLMVLTAPVITFIIGHYFVWRLKKVSSSSISATDVWHEWKLLASFGIPFMFSILVTQVSYLIVRVIVQQQLGIDSLGQFQAASAIGVMYMGFIMGAMATDYYPRLSGVINDPIQASKFVNEQTEVVLLLCGPFIVAMLGLAPLVIRLLYSADFDESAVILRWQMLGDALRLLSWPMGYIIMARGSGLALFASEFTVSTVFVCSVYIGLPLIGVEATGVAFFLMYVVHLPLMWILGGRSIRLKWTRAIKLQFLMIVLAMTAVLCALQMSELAGALTGALLGALLMIWALIRLVSIVSTDRHTAFVVRLGQNIRAKIARWS